MSNALRKAQAAWDHMTPADADRDELAAQAISERLDSNEPGTCLNYAEHAACNIGYKAQTALCLGIIGMSNAKWAALAEHIAGQSPLLGVALNALVHEIVNDRPAFIADELDYLTKQGEMDE